MISKYFVLLIAIGVAAAEMPIPVTIYYETLCADSMKFFTEQLVPTWKVLNASMTLDLVPFGKSNWTGMPPDVTFHCHHGDNECLGNKVQSCLINSSNHVSLSDKVNFIDCLMKNGKKDEPYDTTVQNCKINAVAPSVQPTDLNSCAKGPQGTALLMENGKRTNARQNPLESVPTVVFNNKWAKETSTNAVSSFQKTLCSFIDEKSKPKACNGAAIKTVSLMTLVAAVLLRML